MPSAGRQHFPDTSVLGLQASKLRHHLPSMSQLPEEPLDLSHEQGFGYFPGYPGSLLKEGRYKILRKLGFGPRSSVWLASDLQ